MREPASLSPFAALSPREQKEQWIWWQCQKIEAEQEIAPSRIETEETAGALPEFQLPKQRDEDKAKASSLEQEKPQRQRPVYSAPTIRHGQYDAVIRRMKDAGRMAGNYTPWTE